jgi:hypothetical protein
MVINTLRAIPANERLEIVFERQDRYWWMTEIAMTVISQMTHYPDILLPNGTPKLANWRSVPKGSTPLLEPADYFAYALLQVWRDQTSVRSQWCNPILKTSGGEGYGAILDRHDIRNIIRDGKLLFLFNEAAKMLGSIHGQG